MRRAALILAALFGAASSCFLEPDPGLSCGDGWVSPAEQCDPEDPEHRYRDACRDRGFAKDAACDAESCVILASNHDCNVCGDGVVADGEECDGEQLEGETCPNGADKLRCTDECRLDYDDCPLDCGDGVVTDNEECDPEAYCNNADDCRNGTYCNGTLCVDLAEDSEPIEVCSDLRQTFVLGKAQFVTGEIYDCRQSDCRLSRDQCSFCGDGVLDLELEIEPPMASESFTIPPEFCDGTAIDQDDLVDWCRPLCGDPQDRRVRCNFQCKTDCSGFDDVPDFLGPDTDFGCCLIKDEPCEIGGDLQCCDAADPGSVSLGTCKSPGDGLPAVCH